MTTTAKQEDKNKCLMKFHATKYTHALQKKASITALFHFVCCKHQTFGSPHSRAAADSRTEHASPCTPGGATSPAASGCERWARRERTSKRAQQTTAQGQRRAGAGRRHGQAWNETRLPHAEPTGPPHSPAPGTGGQRAAGPGRAGPGRARAPRRLP